MEGLKELLAKHKESELSEAQFEEELNKILPKAWKPASVFNELNEKYKAIEKQNADYVKAIEDGNKNKTSVEDLNKQLDQLKAQHKAETDKLNSDFAEYKKNSYIDSELSKAGARAVKAVRAYIDSSKVNLADDGNYIGLKEQIDSVKSNEETSYLFSTDSSNKNLPHFDKGGSDNHTPPANDFEEQMAKAIGGNF